MSISKSYFDIKTITKINKSLNILENKYETDTSIKKARKYINKISKSKNTLLMNAIINNNEVLALRIIPHLNPNTINKINNNGNTAFMLACISPISNNIAFNIMAHPYFDSKNLNLINSDGNNSLMCVLSNFNNQKSELALQILSRPDFTKINQINNVGMTSLMLACSFKFSEIAKVILDRNDFICIYNVNSQGFCALDIAQKNELYDIVYYIQYNISKFTEEKNDLNQIFNLINKYSHEII